MGIILTILAFNFIIIIHELGHFLVARMNGIKVLEFSLFVGPKIWGIKRGDTCYTLRLIPVLAYVKMEGEEETSDDVGSFSNKSVWARMAVVAAGPFANLLSALVILTIIFSIRGYQTTTVVDVEPDSIAQNVGIQNGDKIIYYNNSRIYLPSDLSQFFYVHNKEEADLTILRGNEKKHIKVSPGVVKEDVYVLGIAIKESNSTVVDEIVEGYPAQRAGILPGDKVLLLNNDRVSNLQDILRIVNANQDRGLDVVVSRNSQELKFRMIPKHLKDRPIVNLGVDFEVHKGNVGEVVGHSVKYIWANIRNVGCTLKWLVSGKVSVSKMSGPVGIVTTMNDAANTGENIKEKMLSLLGMTAFISVAIGATNLIPFPALDGNKLLLLMVEAIRKKPIPPEKESKISMVGIVVLLGLALVTTSNDIMRLIQRIRN